MFCPLLRNAKSFSIVNHNFSIVQSCTLFKQIVQDCTLFKNHCLLIVQDCPLSKPIVQDCPVINSELPPAENETKITLTNCYSA